jgi:hypothetical protein
VLLTASPLLEGVTGRYFQDNQETEIVEDGPALMAAGGPGAMVGVAEWAVDPAATDRLWEYASTTISNAANSDEATRTTSASPPSGLAGWR